MGKRRAYRAHPAPKTPHRTARKGEVMTLILRELGHAFNLGALMREDKTDILASAFNATKLWNKIIVHCAVIRTKLFRKSGQVQRNVVMTAIAVSRDPVSVLDALTNRSVGADVAHSALLSGSYYNRNETETNYKVGCEIDSATKSALSWRCQSHKFVSDWSELMMTYRMPIPSNVAVIKQISHLASFVL
jgi:hypothetical protein